MSGLNPTLPEEMRDWLREQRRDLNRIERLVDRVEELEWENKSLRDRIDIMNKARKGEADADR